MNLTGKYSVFTIRLRPADVRKLQRRAKELRWPMSMLVREMLLKQLDAQKRGAE